MTDAETLVVSAKASGEFDGLVLLVCAFRDELTPAVLAHIDARCATLRATDPLGLVGVTGDYRPYVNTPQGGEPT